MRRKIRGDVAPISDAVFTIGRIAKDFDVSTRTLRFYEARGLLHPVRRGTTRLYTVEDRGRIEFVLRAKKLGFTVADIHEMLDCNDTKS